MILNFYRRTSWLSLLPATDPAMHLVSSASHDSCRFFIGAHLGLAGCQIPSSARPWILPDDGQRVSARSSHGRKNSWLRSALNALVSDGQSVFAWSLRGRQNSCLRSALSAAVSDGQSPSVGSSHARQNSWLRSALSALVSGGQSVFVGSPHPT